MNDPIQSSLPAVAPAASGPKPEDRASVKQLAQQFEAMLLTQMLRAMRQSMVDDEEQDGFGKSMMTDAFDTELGQSLTRAGGIGLQDMLIRAFDRQHGRDGQDGQDGRDGREGQVGQVGEVGQVGRIDSVNQPVDIVQPAADSSSPRTAPSGPVMPEGRVTSGFGWRSDPFNGRTRFHSGTDVKMAYGQDVKSAAGGKVTFVGEQSGYGLTVMVDHGNGVESRYAHLSSATVRKGEPVETGQVIALSGNSGRSTGPHLHFEVLDNGRAVAPETMAEHLH